MHGKECWAKSKNKRDGEGGNRKMEHAGNMRGGDIARDGGSGSKSKGGSLASKPGRCGELVSIGSETPRGVGARRLQALQRADGDGRMHERRSRR